MAASADGRYLATTSHDAYHRTTSLLVFHALTLEPYLRIETDVGAFTRLAFGGPGSGEVWALTDGNRLDRWGERKRPRLLAAVCTVGKSNAWAAALAEQLRLCRSQLG